MGGAIGDDVLAQFLDFLRSGRLLNGMQAPAIVAVREGQQPCRRRIEAGDFQIAINDEDGELDTVDELHPWEI
jgi:hypothetical protein